MTSMTSAAPANAQPAILIDATPHCHDVADPATLPPAACGNPELPAIVAGLVAGLPVQPPALVARVAGGAGQQVISWHWHLPPQYYHAVSEARTPMWVWLAEDTARTYGHTFVAVIRVGSTFDEVDAEGDVRPWAKPVPAEYDAELTLRLNYETGEGEWSCHILGAYHLAGCEMWDIDPDGEEGPPVAVSVWEALDDTSHGAIARRALGDLHQTPLWDLAYSPRDTFERDLFRAFIESALTRWETLPRPLTAHIESDGEDGTWALVVRPADQAFDLATHLDTLIVGRAWIAETPRGGAQMRWALSAQRGVPFDQEGDAGHAPVLD